MVQQDLGRSDSCGHDPLRLAIRLVWINTNVFTINRPFVILELVVSLLELSLERQREVSTLLVGSLMEVVHVQSFESLKIKLIIKER